MQEVYINANVTSATAGAIAFGIFTDGVKLNGGEANTVIAAAGDYDNISIKKYVRVCGRGNVTVSINSLPSVVYDGTTTATQIPIVKNANIIIRRYA